MMNLGNIARKRIDFDEAVRLQRESLAITQERLAIDKARRLPLGTSGSSQKHVVTLMRPNGCINRVWPSRERLAIDKARRLRCAALETSQKKEGIMRLPNNSLTMQRRFSPNLTFKMMKTDIPNSE